MKTLSEICEDLYQVDEISLLELLEISSEELVERFQDKIEDNLEKIRDYLFEDEEEDD